MPEIPPVPRISDQSQWRRDSIKVVGTPTAVSSPLAGPPMRMSSATQPLGADSQFKTTRPVTATSITIDTKEAARKISLSSLNTSNASSVSKRPSVRQAKFYDVNEHTDFHWEVAARNPRNWSRSKRWYNTFMAGKFDRSRETREFF